MVSTAQVVLLFFLLYKSVLGLNNGLGHTPQMGWNSWYCFYCNVSDQIIRETADAIVTKGLNKHGYMYVNIDDCWAKSRSADGTIQPDPDTFPDMKGLADYIHSKGLKFGLYSDAGTETCARRPGSLGYETQDANTYSSWGVDYLKYDNCNSDGSKPEVRYPVMRDALNKTGRPIFYSLCEWGVDNPATWAPEVGNSWRTTGDFQDNWNSLMSHTDQNNQWWEYAGPGGWNDPDIMQIGKEGMSLTEYMTQFSLWALMKAPLLIGCDVRNISDDILNILTNDDVIAINQDKLGVQGNKTKVEDTKEIWQGPLSDGSKAVVLLNRGNSSTSITVQWSDIFLDNNTKATVQDLWAKKNLGIHTGSITADDIPSHGVVMYRITPMSPTRH